jgi:hypothetical protein
MLMEVVGILLIRSKMFSTPTCLGGWVAGAGGGGGLVRWAG